MRTCLETWVCFRTRQKEVRWFGKASQGIPGIRWHLGLQRALLSPFHSSPDRALFCSLIWCLPRRVRVWQSWIEDTNIQGQWLLKWYLHHHFKCSHVRLWITNWRKTKRLIHIWGNPKLPTTNADPTDSDRTSLCAILHNTTEMYFWGALSPQWHITWHDAKHHSIDFSKCGIRLRLIVESDLVLGGSEAVVAFCGYLLRLSHSESCRTLTALLEHRLKSCTVRGRSLALKPTDLASV